MDHFASGGCCSHRHECPPRDLRAFCRGNLKNGCRKLRESWQKDWCKSCRKTPAYAHYLALVEAHKIKYAGMTSFEILNSKLKEAYVPEFFKGLEASR